MVVSWVSGRRWLHRGRPRSGECTQAVCHPYAAWRGGVLRQFAHRVGACACAALVRKSVMKTKAGSRAVRSTRSATAPPRHHARPAAIAANSA
ncbi:DUF6420 family protein [Paraburkholderia sp. 31.1]|uniref:DUF6420 family protein n=1 Tax=Paraburkholderia sp. 31.1 TaxID=2615205 RepID=UPI001CA4553C